MSRISILPTLEAALLCLGDPKDVYVEIISFLFPWFPAPSVPSRYEGWLIDGDGS